MFPALLLAASAQTAPPTLSEFLRPHAHELVIGEMLSGKGAKVLNDGIGEARFVCIGEEHFIGEVPKFAQALFGRLHDEKGFEYLVTENDPYAVQMVEESEAARDGKRIRDELLKKYPNLIAFAMPPELDLVAFVHRTSTVKRPVWGLDQNIGALHILDRLVAIAPTEDSRSAAATLAAKVRPLDSKRAGPNRPHYMSSPAAEDDVKALRAAYGAAPGSEAARLLDLMAMSASVYGAYRRGAADAAANFHSNADREAYMKREFSARYREVAGQKPRLMLKFGMNHLFRGVGLSAGWFTLGNFVSELATYEGTSSVHIAIMAKGATGQYSSAGWAKDFQAAAGDKISVIDLRAARVAARSGQLNVSPTQLGFLDGFDFAVIIANPTPMPLSSADYGG